MDVYWLEQSEADVPAAGDWLNESEVLRLSSLSIPKRRSDWRLGRWTAKCAVAATLNLPDHKLALKDIHIGAASSGEPEVTLPDRTLAVTISISHRAGTAVCAVGLGGAALGCDLEAIEPRSDAFIADYFTPLEQELIAQIGAADRYLLITLIWSAKESALKALHVGLRADTRSVEVSFGRNWPMPADDFSRRTPDVFSVDASQHVGDWLPLIVTHTNGQCFSGWWQIAGRLVRTLATAQASSAPRILSAIRR
jgi:4'-phosphopantetheinyl transferase